MAEPLRDADLLQKQLSEFQDLQRQLQVMMSQKQQLFMQLEEMKLAGEELSKSDKAVYRYSGSILIECSKADAQKDLADKKELFEMRIGILDKQDAKIRPRLEELKNALEKALREGKLTRA